MRIRTLLIFGPVVVLALVGVGMYSYYFGFQRGKDAATKLNETAASIILKGEMMKTATIQSDLARLVIQGDESALKNAKKLLKASLETYQKEERTALSGSLFDHSGMDLFDKDVSEALAALSTEP
jgi:hypothetical protein